MAIDVINLLKIKLAAVWDIKLLTEKRNFEKHFFKSN